MEVEKEITTKEGRTLRVWVEDHGSSTTLFYIHGSMASHRQFQLLRDAMNDKSSNDAMNDKSSNDAMNDKSSNVVAYDALGCGESEKPNGDFYGTEDLADDALYIFREFATKHNILISHSYGTCVAARLVAKYQKLNDYDDDDAEKEKKKNSSSGMNNNNDEDNSNNDNNNNNNNNNDINNNNTNNNNNNNTNNNDTTTTTNNTNNNNKPLIEAVILLGTELSRPAGGHPIFALPSLLLDCLQGYLSKQFVKVAFSPATSEDLKLKCLNDSDTNSMYVCKSFYSGFQWAREEEWRALSRVPVLVLQGKDDLITGLEGAQALYHTHFKANPLSAMLVVGDAGHQIMQEKPNECSSAIIEFLSRLEFKNAAFNVM